MKNRLKKLMNLDQSQKFEIILFSSACMHLTFLIMFMTMKLWLMMCFNIFSVSLYAAGAVDCIKKRVGRRAKFWIIAVFTEIVLHAALCTIIQGLEVCFFLYLMLTIPISGYCLFFYVSKDAFYKITVAFTITTVLVILLCVGFVEIFGSVYDITGMHTLTPVEITVERSINVSFSVITLFGFTFLFYLEISSLFQQLKNTNTQLEYTATHDALTGLSNRHSLWKFFEGLLGSGDHYCVVLGDIDDFKKVNDTYGHDCGDEVLKAVSKILLDHTEENDMACRWGGEELLLVMRGDKRGCYARVDDIKKQISSLSIMSEGRRVKVSMTFGFVDCAELEAELSEHPNSGNLHVNMDSMISMADKKLYIGKNSGKNVIVA